MTHKEVDLALHPVVGVVLQVGDAEKFPQARGFESLDPFFGVSKQGPCFTAREENGGDKNRQILFSLAICVYRFRKICIFVGLSIRVNGVFWHTEFSIYRFALIESPPLLFIIILSMYQELCVP